jgi:hypothetical protein
VGDPVSARSLLRRAACTPPALRPGCSGCPKGCIRSCVTRPQSRRSARSVSPSAPFPRHTRHSFVAHPSVSRPSVGTRRTPSADSYQRRRFVARPWPRQGSSLKPMCPGCLGLSEHRYLVGILKLSGISGVMRSSIDPDDVSCAYQAVGGPDQSVPPTTAVPKPTRGILRQFNRRLGHDAPTPAMQRHRAEPGGWVDCAAATGALTDRAR